jgi:hypothetical protein
VLRRCPTPLIMLVAALASGLGFRPSLAQAASSNPQSISTYSWITSVDIPALTSQSTGPQIQFLVEPAGALGPNTDPLAGPLSVTPTLDSSNTALVGLKNTTINGQAEQLLGFAFSNGLKAGSVLQAPLYYNSAQPPQLIPYDTAGISAYTPPTGSASGTVGSQTSGAGGTPDVQTPEPLSLLIWVAFAGSALARARFPGQSSGIALRG